MLVRSILSTCKLFLPSLPGGGSFINKIMPVPVAKAKRQLPSWQSQLANVEQDCEKVPKFEGSLKSRVEKSLKIEY